MNVTKDLGVILEDTGSFNSQIKRVCRKVRQKCGWVIPLGIENYSRNTAFMRYIWNTFVQPHIDYCRLLWSPHYLQRIEKLLHSFTAIITAIRQLNYRDRLKSIRMS